MLLSMIFVFIYDLASRERALLLQPIVFFIWTKTKGLLKDLDNEEKVVKEISSFLRRKLQTNLSYISFLFLK